MKRYRVCFILNLSGDLDPKVAKDMIERDLRTVMKLGCTPSDISAEYLPPERKKVVAILGENY